MIARDEKGALHLLDEHDIILEAHIKKNKGKIIKHIGDAIFAEFDDSNLAAKASIGIQNQLRSRNDYARGKDQIVVRIGLHYGSIVEKGNDLFGNDVNLCARIEPTAIPGGISTSKNFLDRLSDKDLFTRSYGHVRLKNIPKSTELFRIYIDKKDYLSQNQDDLIQTLIGRGVKIVSADEELDTYNTIAILYPENLGSEKEEFFCYEFLDQMINDLKKIDEIRTPSIFDVQKYKNSKESISQISIDLAVENIAQLSVLSDGDTFKVNVLLTSMSSGEEILSESWDDSHNNMGNISGKIISKFADKLSVTLSDSVKELFNRENKVDNKAYKLFLEGKYQSDIMKNSESFEKSETLLTKAIDIDDNFSEAHAALAMTKNIMGEFEDAEDELDIALEIAEDTDNNNALSLIYNYFGIFYKEQKRFDKSLKYFKKGIKLQKVLHNDYMHANLLHNMSSCYGLTGDMDRRLSCLNQSQRIYDKLDETINLGNSYAQMGNAYKSTNNLKESIEYYDKAISIFISEEMNFKYAQALILQSEVYLSLNDYKKAKDNLNKAATIAEEFDIPQMNGRIYLVYAQINMEEDDEDEALDNLEEALDIFIDINNKLRSSDVLLMMGFLYLKKDKLKKAEKCYKRAKRLSKNLEGSYSNSTIEKLKNAIDEHK